jgi:hypothetical protein
MKRWAVQLLWLLYSVIFVYLAVAAIRDDIRLAYPAYFTVPAALSYAVATCGISVHALRWPSGSLTLLWRRIFPILIALPLIGVVLDAIVPEDYNLRTHGLRWLLLTALVLVLLAPGYYANFRVAYR